MPGNGSRPGRKGWSSEEEAGEEPWAGRRPVGAVTGTCLVRVCGAEQAGLSPLSVHGPGAWLSGPLRVCFQRLCTWLLSCHCAGQGCQGMGAWPLPQLRTRWEPLSVLWPGAPSLVRSRLWPPHPRRFQVVDPPGSPGFCWRLLGHQACPLAARHRLCRGLAQALLPGWLLVPPCRPPEWRLLPRPEGWDFAGVRHAGPGKEASGAETGASGAGEPAGPSGGVPVCRVPADLTWGPGGPRGRRAPALASRSPLSRFSVRCCCGASITLSVQPPALPPLSPPS